MANEQQEAAIAPQQADVEPRAAGERHTFVQLFGPVQENSALLQTASGNWNMPGAATSTSMKPFWFGRAWRNIAWASFRVEWRPGSSANAIRLMHCADGVVDVRQIAEVQGANTNNPTAASRDVTAALQQLAREGRTRNLGWQVRGDGRTQFRVFQVWLEILERP